MPRWDPEVCRAYRASLGCNPSLVALSVPHRVLYRRIVFSFDKCLRGNIGVM